MKKAFLARLVFLLRQLVTIFCGTLMYNGGRECYYLSFELFEYRFALTSALVLRQVGVEEKRAALKCFFRELVFGKSDF